MARQELAFEKKNHGKNLHSITHVRNTKSKSFILASCIEQVSYSCNLLAFRVPVLTDEVEWNFLKTLIQAGKARFKDLWC
jgi:hypothetical protein